MDVIAGNANRGPDCPGKYTRVSTGDVSGSGTFVAAKERQLRTEARLSSEAEAELLLKHGFQVGDMVWGKVKSHPWWPGYIFQESICHSFIRRAKREGCVLVAFFGDNSYGWIDPAELLPFNPHFADKSLQSTSTIFVDAVKDAIDEVSRRGALGLSCCCLNPQNFRKATIPGYFGVDVLGYDNTVVYSRSVIDKARDNFVPVDVMSFLSNLAAGPCEVDLQHLDAVKMVAIFEAFRKTGYNRLVDKFFEGPEPTKRQSAPHGTLQLPTVREPRGATLSGNLLKSTPLHAIIPIVALMMSISNAQQQHATLTSPQQLIPPSADHHPTTQDVAEFLPSNINLLVD